MIDNHARKWLDPLMDKAGSSLARSGVSADAVTLAGFILAIFAAAFAAQQFFHAALLCMFASRACDGLDGAVARFSGRTDFGGYLDIVLDFAFYGLIPLAFAFADPAGNALAAGVLLLSFYVNGASFLAFAAIAEKRGLSPDARGQKSFLFTTGLAEAGETLAVFTAMCLFPAYFALIAWAFAAIVFWTALVRILAARSEFR
ncbi:MAG: CDP-alcohol phosphatidyltransferase family protein [Nitratireductor sp.]|jgi:phosphatidylglycerophosphate synthase|nr:CDP-alcohol phosphatidyltransferase family protein [Nitratireductor sp.]